MSTFPAPTTLPSCGPGSYDISPNPKVRPNFIGFSSTTYDRSIIRTPPSPTPGPGHYHSFSSPLPLPQQQQQQHTAVFKSRAPRLAPTITGSTLFTPSTILDNPGPGTYRLAPPPILHHSSVSSSPPPPRRTNQGIRRRHRPSFHSTPVFVVAQWDTDCPRRGLASSHRDPFTTTTTMRRSAPSSDDRRTCRSAELDRTESWIRKSITPGPSSYAPRMPGWDDGVTTVPFRSRVKMAHQTRDKVDTRGRLTEDAKDLMTTNDDDDEEEKTKRRTTRATTSVQSFGSLAKRDTGPRLHEERIPFPSRAEMEAAKNVGPGSYDARVPFGIVKNDNPSLSTRVVGFNSTAARPCCRRPPPSDTPGPQTHDPERYYRFRTLNRYAVGRNGVFGTTAARFPAGGFTAPLSSSSGPIITEEILPPTTKGKNDEHPMTRRHCHMDDGTVKKPKFVTGLFNKNPAVAEEDDALENMSLEQQRRDRAATVSQKPPPPFSPSKMATPLKSKIYSSSPLRRHSSFGSGGHCNPRKNIDGSYINDSPGVGTYNLDVSGRKGQYHQPCRSRSGGYKKGTFGTDGRFRNGCLEYNTLSRQMQEDNVWEAVWVSVDD